jgi:rhomboid protease GluP
MAWRRRTGSVLCPGCGRLVGVSDDRCLNCGRRNPGMWGLTSLVGRLGRDMGFVQALFGGCVLLYVLMLVVDPNGIRYDSIFSFLGPSARAELRFGAAGGLPVFGLGRWWTLLSAGWLHAGLLHIAFNLSWVRMLAPNVAEFYGASRMVILYTISGIVGFGLSSLVQGVMYAGHGGMSVGASAPILGLVAALVYYGRRSGSRAVHSQAWAWAGGLLLFGFFMPGVDNWAHIGGFCGGYATARILDPLKPERGDHTVWALACLGLTALSVIASLVVGVPFP